MSLFNIFMRLICLLALSMPSYLYAESNSQIGTQQFTLSSQDTISQEVLLGSIMRNVPKDFNGEIKLVWTNQSYAEAARSLRTSLIERGIAPYRIQLIHDMGGYREMGSDGVQIYLQQIILRLPECRDRTLSYHFDNHADQGCALTNTLSRTLVNPFLYVF